MSVIVGLPDAIGRAFPELAAAAWPDEARSTCAACPLVAEGRFNPATRCCTYHPTLANWQAGRALARGGDGAVLVRARIARGEGVGPLGIGPTEAFVRRYARPDAGFGTDARLRCPYWAGGEFSCGVWSDRNATCRTWFCRHDDGVRGPRWWSAVREALGAAEQALARRCIEGAVPPAEPDTDVWVAWFEACAARADAVRDLEVPDHAALIAALGAARAELEAGLPDRLMGAITDATVRGDRIVLVGASRYDPYEGPVAVRALIDAMTGGPWREAMARASAATGVAFDEALVTTLYRRGLLVAAAGSTAPDHAARCSALNGLG